MSGVRIPLPPNFLRKERRSPVRRPKQTAIWKPPLLGLVQATKMPDGLGPSGILIVDLQQRLNCALPFQSSSSLGFFRFQGLNGIFSDFSVTLAVDLFNPERIRGEFSLERR